LIAIVDRRQALGCEVTAKLGAVALTWRMTVDAWVLEAVESAGSKGATVREVQRTIDEKHFEELAIDTIEASVAGLLEDGRLVGETGRYHLAKRTSKEDALKRLFGDG